ncbi:16410_t:CDS:2, partial [Funneliformis geosporum]
EDYDIGLAIAILQGLRERTIPDTPEDYVIIYTGCWDNEPDNRPSMSQVVDKLNAIITITSIKENSLTNKYEPNLQHSNNIDADSVKWSNE